MAAKIPRNVRQVGSPGKSLSIYMEDYVFTYLKSEYNSEAAILVGESVYEDEGVRVYIRGAIACPQLFWREEGMEISPRTWNYIYREIEHLYNQLEVVGWYLPIPSGNEEKILVTLGEFHGRNFPGVDKVFFYMNPHAGDEAFYIREGQVFKRQNGYYIFYEKNMAMRDYMLARREERQLEADLYREVHDKPREVARYREFVNLELDKKNKESSLLAYALSVFALVGVFALVIGVATGYREINEMGDIIETIGNIVNIDTDDDIDEISQDHPTVASEQENITTPETTTPEAMASETAPSEEVISKETTTEETTTDSEAMAALSQGFYVVQQGESLAAISRKLYGTDDKVTAICEKNAIADPDSIYPGQTLYLP